MNGRFGQRIEVFPMQVFDFESIAAGQTQSEIVRRDLDVANYGAGVFLIRVHENLLGASRVVSFALNTTAPSRYQPNVDFVSDELLAFMQFNSSALAGSVEMTALEPGFGASLQLLVSLNNSSGSGSGGGTITLSADLIMRAGTPMPLRDVGEFAYQDKLAAAKGYVPFKGTQNSASIDFSTTRVMAYPGIVEKVVLYASAAGGSTVVGYHLNGSASPTGTSTRTLAATTATEFTFSGVKGPFDANTRLHISVDPTTSPGTVTGYYVVRYGRMWG